MNAAPPESGIPPRPVEGRLAAAQREAQWIAFAPLIFQVARALRDSGVLARLGQSARQGLTQAELKLETGLSDYALQVLLEGGTAAHLVEPRGDRWVVTPTGLLIERDPMTRVNLDFVQDVCYEGAGELLASLQESRPAGLAALTGVTGPGAPATVYAALAGLPAPVRNSWFAFDHFYSDAAFPQVLPLVLAGRPRTLLDIGGNTGRWALTCAKADSALNIVIADLPGQLEVALRAARDAGLDERITGHPVDLLDPASPLPEGADALWMSQFLCCFSPEEQVGILRRAVRAMSGEAVLWILETFTDSQSNPLAAFCLKLTSLYFTTIANGNSRMYRSDEFAATLTAAGLRVEQEWTDLGLGHTLLRCRRQ